MKQTILSINSHSKSDHMLTYLPVALLCIVILSSMTKKIGNIVISVWLVMLLAAACTIIFANISLIKAYHAVDFDIIGYLLGVFIIGSALEDSRILEKFALHASSRATSQNKLLLKLIFIFGILSAILLNDTIAIIGAAVAIILIKNFKVAAKPFIYATAFSITIGSVMSPIGNPQNLLIANVFHNNVFIYFIVYLGIPTIISLYLCYWVISKVFKESLATPLEHVIDNIKIDKIKFIVCVISLSILLILIAAKIITNMINPEITIDFAYIALIPTIPIILFYPSGMTVFKNIDWRTILFFIGMFILIAAVWNTGLIQKALSGHSEWFDNIIAIIIISILLSQVVSNAPMVILILPFITGTADNQPALLSLAVGSTLAGNLTMLGAASNIIVFQNAYRKGIDCFSFKTFSLIGLAITIPSIFLYIIFLNL